MSFNNLSVITTMTQVQDFIFENGQRIWIATSFNGQMIETGAACIVSSLYDRFLRTAGSYVKRHVRRSPCGDSRAPVARIFTFIAHRGVPPQVNNGIGAVREVIQSQVRTVVTPGPLVTLSPVSTCIV